MSNSTYLDVDDVLEIFDALIGPPLEVLRSRALLESAVTASRQPAFGADAYATIARKACGSLRSLAQNHAFIDGNKRIAWASMRAFLLCNGVGLRAPVEIVEDLMIGLTAGTRGEHDVLAFLEQYCSIVSTETAYSDATG